MRDIGLPSDGLPELGRYDLFRKRARAVQNLRISAVDVEQASLGQQQIWLQQHAAMTPMLTSLGRDLAILQRAATRSEIVDALRQLDDMPAGKQSSSGAKRMLVGRVGAQEPSLGAVNFAVLDVLDREDWFPAPAKMVKALAEAEQYLADVGLALSNMPKWNGWITVALAENERSQALAAQRQAARIAQPAAGDDGCPPLSSRRTGGAGTAWVRTRGKNFPDQKFLIKKSK